MGVFFTQIRVIFNQPSKCKSSITGCVFTNLGQWQYFCMIHKTFIQRWLFLNICVLSFFVCTLRWRIYIILECSGKLFSNIKFMCSAFQHLITNGKFLFLNFCIVMTQVSSESYIIIDQVLVQRHLCRADFRGNIFNSAPGRDVFAFNTPTRSLCSASVNPQWILFVLFVVGRRPGDQIVNKTIYQICQNGIPI